MPDFKSIPGGRDQILEQAGEDLIDYLCHDNPGAKARLLRADSRLSRRGRLTVVETTDQHDPEDD